MSSAKNRIEDILRREGLNLSEDVIQTVMKISRGDMRKIINLFQSIHLQYSGMADENPNKIELESGIGSECTPESVYTLTGTLPPSKIQDIFRSLMNEDLESSLETIQSTLDSSDANIASILPYLTDLFIKEVKGENMKFMKMDIINLLADIEKKAIRDIPEHLLRDYMVSQFYILRNM
jgi:replication factor C subunit 3/5